MPKVIKWFVPMTITCWQNDSEMFAMCVTIDCVWCSCWSMKLLASIVDDDDYFESFNDLFDTRQRCKGHKRPMQQGCDWNWSWLYFPTFLTLFIVCSVCISHFHFDSKIDFQFFLETWSWEVPPPSLSHCQAILVCESGLFLTLRSCTSSAWNKRPLL